MSQNETKTDEDNDENHYENIKKKSRGSDPSFLVTEGIDYIRNEPLLLTVFNSDTAALNSGNDKEQPRRFRRSYIYVISKKVDGRTFIKVGFSDVGSSKSTINTRLESAQTFLIPGLKNAGFKIHYLFFYKLETKDSGQSLAHIIEKRIHEHLRNDYETAVIYFGNNEKSEWYLPSKSQYKRFFEFIIKLLSLQIPTPHESYRFSIENGKKTRQFIKTITEHTREEIIKYRFDLLKFKKTARAKANVLEVQALSRKGSKAHFTKILIENIKNNEPPLGNNTDIVSIYSHNTKSNANYKFQNIYVRLQSKNKDPPEVNNLIVDKSDPKETVYYSHIGNILDKMNELDSLKTYSLESNYHFYNNRPIKMAKYNLEREFGHGHEYKNDHCEWLIGRIARDSTNTLYKAIDIKFRRNSRVIVEKIVFKELDKTTMKFAATNNIVNADPYIAIQLVVHYHDNDHDVHIKHEITTPDTRKIIRRTDTKYDQYQIVRFDPLFFTKTITDNRGNEKSEKDTKEYYGVILNNFMGDRYNKDTKKTEFGHHYDVLMKSYTGKDEIMVLPVKTVDENTTIPRSDRLMVKFLNTVDSEKKSHYYEMNGLIDPDSLNITRKVNYGETKQNKTTIKKKAKKIKKNTTVTSKPSQNSKTILRRSLRKKKT